MFVQEENMIWNKDVFRSMVKVAIRAPSVHNVQPWKVRYTDTGFQLFQSTKRRLHVGDPKLHDNDVSLGAFLELCRMHLKTIGIEFSATNNNAEKYLDYESRFNITISECSPEIDKLYRNISKRRSYRGQFNYDKSFDHELLESIQVEKCKIKWMTGPEETKKWAVLYDNASSKINQIPGYFKELTDWIRFNKNDPKYFEDGLNAEALSLNNTDALFGKMLFRVPVFKTLALLKMDKILITEAPQIQSAQGIIAVYVDKNLTSLQMGAAFVRFWLELTSKGLYGCPLSALVDFTQTRDILNSLKPSDDMICLNVLRFGKVSDEGKIYHSPRLDVSRVII